MVVPLAMELETSAVKITGVGPAAAGVPGRQEDSPSPFISMTNSVDILASSRHKLQEQAETGSIQASRE